MDGRAAVTRRVIVKRIAVGILAFGSMAGTAFAQQPCEQLKSLEVGTATISSAVFVPQGPFVPPGAKPTANPPVVPARCEIHGVIRPTKDSEIKFAMWLPAGAAWNGKYRQEGNGGWAGSIRYNAMIDPLRRGYATASTDNGHEGPGATWAVGHPEKLIDFGHRAVHELAVHAKGIIEAHYGTQSARNYFFGCSDGGREALMEAQRYPEDFDGLIVSAPANRWSHLFTSFVWNELAQMKTPGSAIPPAKLPFIQQAVLAACDGHDGVKDGLLEDPRSCNFNPEVLACRGEDDNATCLTRPQLDALKAIYAGPQNPRTGEQIYPGLPPGTEGATWPNWVASVDPAKTIQATLGNPYYGQAVFENLDWDVRTMDFDKDFLYGEQKAAPVLNSSSLDLRSFRANGGKIIHYHGWGDAAITAHASIEYYDAVRAFMSKYPDNRSKATGQLEDFYRLFLIPGLGHCQGGIGPNRFGNDGAVRPETANDPERDVFAALERWVEKGVPPEQLLGEGAVPGEPDKRMTRPICRYPSVARYRGSGDIFDAASFVCAAPDSKPRP